MNRVVADEFLDEVRIRALSRGSIKEAVAIARSELAAPRVRLRLEHELVHGRRAAVAPGETSDGNWAEALADAGTSQARFIETITPRSGFDWAMANGATVIPLGATTRAFSYATSIGNAARVAEVQPKPLTSFTFAADTLTPQKVAGLIVVTDELLLMPTVDATLRRLLANAVISATNEVFLADLVSTGTPEVTSSGPTAANVLTDLRAAAALLTLSAGSRLVLFVPGENMASLALKATTDGAAAFPGLTPNGGDINGIAVVPVNGLADTAVLADLSQMVVAAQPLEADASKTGTVLMSDTPSSPANLVSLFQTDSTAILAERFIAFAAIGESVAIIEAIAW